MMSAKAFFSLSVSPSSQHALQNTMHTTMMIFFLRKRDENATFFSKLSFASLLYTLLILSLKLSCFLKLALVIKVRRNSYVCDYSCGLLGPASLYAQGHWSQLQLLLHCNLTYTTDFSRCLNNMWSSTVIESASSILSRCVFFQWIIWSFFLLNIWSLLG